VGPIQVRWPRLLGGSAAATDDPPPARVRWTPEGWDPAEAAGAPAPRVWSSVFREVRRHLEADADGFGFLFGRVARDPVDGGSHAVMEAAWHDPSWGPLEGASDGFEEAWTAAALEAARQGREVMGWYHRHILAGLTLTRSDQAIHGRYFLQPHQYALVHIAGSDDGSPQGALFGRTRPGAPLRPVAFEEVAEMPPSPATGAVPSAVSWSNHHSDHPVEVDGPESAAEPPRPARMPAPPPPAPWAHVPARPAAVRGPARAAKRSRRARDDDGTPDLLAYWRVIREQRATVLGVFALVVAAVAAGTLMQTPQYRAAGMIELRQQATEIVSAGDVQGARVSEQHLQTQYEILQSPALARRVVADLGLAGAAADEEAVADAAERVRDGLTVDPVTGSQLVRVSFEGEDPELAARIVNSLFANYITLRTDVGRATAARLEQQLDSVRAGLAASEARLQSFTRASGLLAVGSGTGEGDVAGQRLRDLQAQLTTAEAERYEKESQYNLLQRQGDRALNSAVLQSLSVQAAGLRGEYARLQSTFGAEYPRTRETRSQLAALEAQIARERRRVAEEIRSGYLAAVRRQELLQQALDGQRSTLDALAGRMAQHRILQRDAAGHQQLYEILQQRQKTAEAAAALAAAEVGIVDRATPPRSPVSPDPARNLQLAVLVGLMLGVGAGFFREWATGAVRTVEEVGAISGAPVLGAIPSAASPRVLRWLPRRGFLAPAGRDEAGWVRIDRGEGAAADLAEAFGSLRTSVLYDHAGSRARSILVTSAQPRDGKTTVSLNFALSLAKLGRRVLLVDADLRRPSLHRALGIVGRGGLADALRTPGRWQRFVRRDCAPGLDVLPAGDVSGGFAELLASPPMRTLLDEAQLDYDYVVVDAPALLINAADARILATQVDGVLLVARSGVTGRGTLLSALRQLPNVSGVVLNDLDASSFPAYYRDYATPAQLRDGSAASPG
jgi:succinoglycan biosynthesis transport protein ExoP